MANTKKENFMDCILNLNFYAENISDDKKTEFHNAILYEYSRMMIEYLKAQIVQAKNKIKNLEKESAETKKAEIESLREKIVNLEVEVGTYEQGISMCQDDYEIVLQSMTAKNADHFGNNADVVRSVFRILATYKNNKLLKYAMIPVFESPILYECMEVIHVNSNVNEYGTISMTKKVKDAYKKASDELERIIKINFSLPFETSYTCKTRIKLNASDKKLLYDCYIKGFNNKFISDKDNNVSYAGREFSKLVKVTTNKKGEKKYNYGKLAECLISIVMKYYFVED